MEIRTKLEIALNYGRGSQTPENISDFICWETSERVQYEDIEMPIQLSFVHLIHEMFSLATHHVAFRFYLI
jgi:hypothetical protein